MISAAARSTSAPRSAPAALRPARRSLDRLCELKRLAGIVEVERRAATTQLMPALGPLPSNARLPPLAVHCSQRGGGRQGVVRV